MNNPFFDPQNQSDNLNNNDRFDTNEQPSPQTTKSLRKLFTILLSIGLVIGIISSVVIVQLMNKYGLTEKTNQMEQIRGN